MIIIKKLLKYIGIAIILSIFGATLMSINTFIGVFLIFFSFSFIGIGIYAVIIKEDINLNFAKKNKQAILIATIPALLLSLIAYLGQDKVTKTTDINESKKVQTIVYTEKQKQDMIKSTEKRKEQDIKEIENKIKEIENRYKDNEEFIKKYYSSNTQLNKFNEDYLWILALNATSKVKNNNISSEMIKKVKNLKPKLEIQARKMYASTLEHKMMDAGQDMSFSAKGNENKTLYIKWILMGKATAYKFNQEISETAKGYGFTKIIYSDGYNETWTYDL